MFNWIILHSNETPKKSVFILPGGGDMTPEQARAYLDRTEWYEMAERALKQPMPEYVRKKREEALAILKKEEQEWKTSLKQ